MLSSPTKAIEMFRVYQQRPSLIAVVLILTSLLTSMVSTRAARPARVVSTAARSAAPAIRETFVFQVGIDKYTSPKVPKLDGCVRDVLDLKRLLIKKFQCSGNNFLTLTDEQATHDGIIAGFKKQLIENARNHRGANVIFQYSGHGSQVKDRSGNKIDGLNSTLVPVNSRDLKGSYLTLSMMKYATVRGTLSVYRQHHVHYRCLPFRQSDAGRRKESRHS